MEMYSAEAAHSFALNVRPYILMFPPCFFLSRCGRCQPAAPTSNTHQLFQFRPTLTPKFHELPSINKSLLLSSFASFEALHCVHRKLTFILVGNWAKKKNAIMFSHQSFFFPPVCVLKNLKVFRRGHCHATHFRQQVMLAPVFPPGGPRSILWASLFELCT